jgi:carbonic anhydrase
MSTPVQRLLENNRSWAAERLRQDAQFFSRLAALQSPGFLWIGCSDSRVPANEITGTQPGEIFVQRNVANLVVHTDVNLLAVLEYAVNFLKVRDIMVVGHYGCGGIAAALTHQDMGILNKWLRHIKDVYRFHEDELLALPEGHARQDRLVELNVEEQVFNLAKTSIIQRAWQREQRPNLHGWVYGLNDGILKPLLDLPAGSPIDDIYRYELDDAQ